MPCGAARLLAQQRLLHGSGGLLAGAHGEDDGGGTGHDVTAGPHTNRLHFSVSGGALRGYSHRTF